MGLDLTISVPAHFDMINYMNYFCASKLKLAVLAGLKKNKEFIVSCQNKEELTLTDNQFYVFSIEFDRGNLYLSHPNLFLHLCLSHPIDQRYRYVYLLTQICISFLHSKMYCCFHVHYSFFFLFFFF
jgi:hypothetical protein